MALEHKKGMPLFVRMLTILPNFVPLSVSIHESAIFVPSLVIIRSSSLSFGVKLNLDRSISVSYGTTFTVIPLLYSAVVVPDANVPLS